MAHIVGSFGVFGNICLFCSRPSCLRPDLTPNVPADQLAMYALGAGCNSYFTKKMPACSRVHKKRVFSTYAELRCLCSMF